MTESRANSKRLSARELNQYLTCALCSGYLIDAVTITECFHSFCKSCFVSYLQKPMLVERAAALLDKCVGCPACLSPLSKPFDSVRKDSLLQSIVFKCIPHVYFSEAERRATFAARGQRAEKGGGNSLSMGSMTEKPVYVVLDHVEMDDLRKRNKIRTQGDAESSHATLDVRDASSNNNYKLQQDMPEKQDEHDGTRQTVHGRLHIRCSSRMPLATLKRFLTLKFGDEAVLFSGDELFDDAHRLAMPLGELIALHCCASVCGERMRSLFEIDPNSEFAHFYFTVL